MSEFGRPKTTQTTNLAPTISAQEQAVGDASANARVLEIQRLAREEARQEAEFAARASTARGVVYAVVAAIALFALGDFAQAARGSSVAGFRGVLTVLLGYHVFLGKPWARIVIAVLAVLTAFAVVPMVVALMVLAPSAALLIGLPFALLFGGCIALFLNPAKHYFYNRN